MTISADISRLLRMMDEVSAFGATPEGGLNRMAGSTDHGRARDWLRGELNARGFAVRVDAIGNLFGVLSDGSGRRAVMVGSHLDSQPFGGRFDGAYGVVAALAATDALRAAGPLAVDLVIVDWMNEEGARFQPSLLGSGVYCGELDLEFALSRTDGDGISVRDELRRTGFLGTDPAPRADAYIELHIEGDDALETAGARIGPFTRYWGALKYRVAMLGETAHTGPTRMLDRRDALLGAARVIAGLREISDRRGGALYTSCGRLVVEPNSPNMVPDRATMFIELRSPDPVELADAEGELLALLPQAAALAQVGHEVISVDRRAAGAFDPRLVALCEAEARARGLPTLRLETIGGHDAVPVSRRMPGIVIAIPSVGGVIHHPTEFSTPEDLGAGVDLIAGMLAALNAAGGDLDRIPAA